MKRIYVSYDVIGDEIIDSFVRKNDEAAKRDFIQAFRQQSRDDTHVKLFSVHYVMDSNTIYDEIEGIPVSEIWDSVEFEKNDEKAVEN